MTSSRSELGQFGPYWVVERIASGGMAEIFKVYRDNWPDQAFALKRIRPDCDDDVEFRKMLMDEAKICSLLNHENIASVVEVVEVEGQLGLILQYVDGVDLGRLKRFARETRQDFSLEASVHIVREILEGLDYAHNIKDEQGDYLNVVHRDVSPGNVMVDVDGRVRLVDFGIARAQNRLAKTEAGNVKGKFRYMAPEQIKGHITTACTDVYSTALVLWELLAGKRIYDDVGVAQLMIRVANADLPTLEDARPGLPASMDLVFRKATELDPRDRYQSARAFADALDSALIEYDSERCRSDLRRLLIGARCLDQERGLGHAVVRARIAAENNLEDAIMNALQSPDRVERVSLERHQVLEAEPLRRSERRVASLLAHGEPLTHEVSPRATTLGPSTAS
ncbi:MAG: serine/threonine protein kinase [Deltaproteobacteria bacterium]|nr:serine/threonine protein kinase [Deltaproteobacteria bacterium]